MNVDDNGGDFENADGHDFDTGWHDIGAGGSVQLDQEWVAHLAQVEPPGSVEGYDPSISDFDHDEQGVGYG